jgi:hypothetical protein
VTAAREMFAKSYFSPGMVERTTVDQTVMSMVAGTYQSFTPRGSSSSRAGWFPSANREIILVPSIDFRPIDSSRVKDWLKIKHRL